MGTGTPATAGRWRAVATTSIVVAVLALVAVELRNPCSFRSALGTPQSSTTSQLFSEPPLGPIPRILHHVLLSGEEGFTAEAQAEVPAFRAEWRQGCQQHFANWEYRFWDEVWTPFHMQSTGVQLDST